MGKIPQKTSISEWDTAGSVETSVMPRVELPQSIPLEQSVSQSTTGLAKPWVAARALVKKVQKQRVPEITQMSSVECGLACLAMMLSYHGRQTTLAELRAQSGPGRDGLSALSIVKIARNYNMRVRAISLQNNDFRNVPLPAIVHWEFNHFIVVERWSPKEVRVVDPAKGRQCLSSEAFDQGFTGIAITMEPGVHFDQNVVPSTRLSLRAYLFQYMKQTPGALIAVLGTSLLLQSFGLVMPLLTKFMLDQVLPLKMNNLMFQLGAGMVLLILTQTTAGLLREWLLVSLRARIDMQMMLDFFERLLTLPYSFFQVRSSGDLLSRMASNTVIRDTLSSQLLETFLDGSTVIIYFIILFWQSPPFAGLALGLGVLQIVLLLSTKRRTHELAQRELAAQGKSQGYMAEALSGMATLKAAGAEQQAIEQWTNLFLEQLNTSVSSSYLSAIVNTMMGLLRSLSPLALLWLGTIQVLHGSLSLGTMFALNALATAFLTPLTSLVSSGKQLQFVRAHFERLADISAAEPEQDRAAVLPPPYLTGRIRLEHVSFRYDPDTPEVLHDINLEIEPGQKIALVGRTGSGKSTLGKLLLGLYLPTQGQILYDNFPLVNLDFQEVRRQFGVVMQDTTLFNGPVRQNIALHSPSITMEQVVEAARLAVIHEDILRMPMGYDTIVAEGGSAVSGGQRQRLAIARAIAHRPAILLLDEATSHLDVLTEQQVEQNLRQVSCTQIIIAHRLSTIRDADVIIVVDHGTIVEKGSHYDLMVRNGYYAQLVRSQVQ